MIVFKVATSVRDITDVVALIGSAARL